MKNKSLTLKDFVPQIKRPHTNAFMKHLKKSTGVNGIKYQFISINDIPDFGYIEGGDIYSPDSPLLYMDEADIDKISLQPYDVLISTFGNPGHAGVVRGDLDNIWITDQRMLLLRFHGLKFDDRKKRSVCLVAYLRSAKVKKMIYNMVEKTGSSKMIKTDRLKDLNLPDFFNDKLVDDTVIKFEEQTQLFDEIKRKENEYNF